MTVATNSTLLITGGFDHDLVNTVVTNLGTIVWDQGRIRGGGGNLNPGSSIYNYGLWDVKNDNVINNDGGGNGTVIYNSGEFRKSLGDPASGTTIGPSVSLLNSGTVSALNGRLFFQQPPTLTGGVLNFGIGGTNTFGVISVSGTANLASGVGATLLNGYLPDVGSTFNVMTYDATNGIFTDYTRLNAGSGVGFTPNIGPTSFTLSTVATNFIPIAPTIINQPAGQKLSYGDNLVLSIGVSGSPVLLYQWRKDNVPVAGATNAVLTVSNVTFAAIAAYTVTITNGSGGVLSQPAQVTVSPIFARHHRGSTETITVAAGSNAVFTVGIKGAPTPTIRWYFNGTNLLVDGGRFSGASSLASIDHQQYRGVRFWQLFRDGFQRLRLCCQRSGDPPCWILRYRAHQHFRAGHRHARPGVTDCLHHHQPGFGQSGWPVAKSILPRERHQRDQCREPRHCAV